MSNPFFDIFTLEQIDEMRRTSAAWKQLLWIESTSPVRICTGETEFNPYRIDGTLDNHRYYPKSMKLSTVRVGTPSSVSISNVDRSLSLNELQNGDLSGADAVVYEFALGTSGSWVHVQSILFTTGKLHWDGQDFKAQLKIPDNLKRRAALSIETTSCSNVYGDPNCTHTGSQCSYTLDSCTTLLNESQFRGHPRALKPGEAVVLPGGFITRFRTPSHYRIDPPGGSGDVVKEEGSSTIGPRRGRPGRIGP